MAKDQKPQDGESTPEELMEIHEGADQDAPTKEETEDLKEFGDEDEPAA